MIGRPRTSAARGSKPPFYPRLSPLPVGGEGQGEGRKPALTVRAAAGGESLTVALFVKSGELEIVSDSSSVRAHAGEAILIPNGAKVTYRGRAGTVGFFVLWPFDWDKKPAAG